jgi:BON domain
MAKKGGRKRDGQPRRESPRRGQPKVSRRTIKRDQDSSQLLERGETPTAEEQVDESVDSPSEITSEGGPGIEASYRFDSPDTDAGGGPNRRVSGRGPEGGFSTLGGGVYPDAGDYDDTPHYGDWQRHSSGGTSGARGQEGLGFPGERTWGEEQYNAERREEQGRRQTGRNLRGVRKSDESLANEIREILTKDPELDATDIGVEVEGGAVTLTGEVLDPDARLLAEELVESTPGVREVHNRLRVAR